MRKLLIVLAILVANRLDAQFVFGLSNPMARSQSAYPQNTPSIRFIGPLTSTWYGKVGDTTCISSGLLVGMGFNFTPWLSISMAVPYYLDIKKTPTTTYESPGLGDIRLNFELRRKINRKTYMAFVPFFTIPSGDLREVPPGRAKSDEDYTGDLFRDYSTTSYDYGAEFLFSSRVKRLFLNLELGFWNAYQMYFMGKSGNLGYFIVNFMLQNRSFNPFLEVFYSKYQDNVFGNAPVFLSPGFTFNITRSLALKSYVDIPLFNRGNVQMLIPQIAPMYAGFLSQFPDYTPKIAFNMGLQFAPKVLITSNKSRVIVFVKDRKTGKPLDNVNCYLDEKYSATKEGMVEFGPLDRGVYELQVQKDGYMPVKRFIKAKGGDKTVVDIALNSDRFVLSVSVRDISGNPVKANILFPELGTEKYSTDDNGNITFEIKKMHNAYPIYVWAKGYMGDNLLVFTPKNSDTLKYTVRLLKYEGGAGLVFPTIYFDLNSARLKKEYIPFLDQIGRYLLENPDVRIEISGYASSDGPESFNRKLSLRRAEACKDYLIERYKIDENRLIVKGFGEENPALPNVGKKREINRRVEFKITE